jgi:hypothetical protein
MGSVTPLHPFSKTIASIVHTVISNDISRNAREERPLASRSEIRTFILDLKMALAREDVKISLYHGTVICKSLKGR